MMQLNRSTPPKATEPRPFHFPDFERFYLDNGLEVLFVQRTEFPLLSVSMNIKSSALADPTGKEGVANLVSELLSEGTKKHSSGDIAEAFEFIAAIFSAHTDWNAIHLDLNTLSQHADQALEIFSDIVLNPLFPEEELERIRKELLTERIRVADNSAKVNSEQFIHELYTNLRYALPVEGKADSISAIQRQDVQKFYDAYFHPNNASLIIVGDLDLNQAKSLCQKHFSDWTGSIEKATVIPEFQQPSQTEVHLVHKPDAAQTELRMGHLGIERKNPDYFAVTLLNEIFGGYFLSRINMNLREKNGFTYGAGSAFSYRKGLGPFHISAAVQSEHTAAAVKEVLIELEAIKKEAVTEEELQNARGQMVGLFPIAFETGDQIAMGISNIIISDLADDYYNTFRDLISKVTREDILKAAQKYLHPQKILIVVTGDRNVIEADLRQSFNVTVYDVLGNVIS